jgi:hypothetical protein
MLLEWIIGRLRVASVHVLGESGPVVVKERVRALDPGLLSAQLTTLVS